MTESCRTISIASATVQKFGGMQDYAAAPYEKFITDIMYRSMRELHISVTDRCNRHSSCMPGAAFDKDRPLLPRTELLNFEEIERLARLFVRRGVQKIHLTGGEPLLRKGIERIVESLARLETMEGKPVEISLTTNAVLLSRKAQALKNAGLSRITVSLDGLSEARRSSDPDASVKTVLDGIAAASHAGIAPINVNMVVKRGTNDHEIIPMAEYFRNSGIMLRFIEYRDAGNSNGWSMNYVVPAREILGEINSHYPIRRADPGYTVTERWLYEDGSGEIGVIASVTKSFCHQCTRARLSTDGKLYTCFFAICGADLRGPLRLGASDETLTDLISGTWKMRFDRYSQLRHTATPKPEGKMEMLHIGG